ncbi:hypothetical protein INT45_011182, partial [Circinella minor]
MTIGSDRKGYMYPDNKHKNLPNFQDYRTLPDPLIDIEQEEVTTRPEPIFDPPLLEKENSSPTLRARICEPDTYNGDRNLDAAKSWARSVERYLTMAKLGEHKWVDYAVILLRGEAEVWWHQQERHSDVDDWTDFKKRLLAVLSQTSSVVAYVTQFQAAWATVPSMTDEEALDRFQRSNWCPLYRGGNNWRGGNGFQGHGDDDKECYNCGGLRHIAINCASRRRQNRSDNYVVPEGELIDLTDNHDAGSNLLNQTLVEDSNYFDSLLSIKETDLPLYLMPCNGCAVKVLIDSGAMGSYVAPRVAIGWPTIVVQGRDVETAGGHILSINKQATLALDAQGYKHQATAYVLDTKFDLILSHDWLKAVQPIPDWELDTWKISKNNQEYLLRPHHKRQIPELSYLLSHRQLQRLDRQQHIDEFFLCYIKPDIDIYTEIPSKKVQSLIAEYKDVFQDTLTGLPPVQDVEHAIETGDAEPIKRPQFKMSPLELDELRRQLKELLDLRLIRPSTSDWGVLVLFVRKADGSMRMCVDYHAINRVTKRQSTPLPRIDECLEKLSGARYFSSIDLKSRYHQVRITQEDIPKTSFNTRYRSFEFLVLPFSLTNAPPTFQRLMNSAKLIANLKKCELFKTELEFVGFRVSAEGILPLKSKIKAVQDWSWPTNVQEVRQFVGLASHYRQFIQGFASIAAPLMELTKGTGAKKRAITWNQECEEAFLKIKDCMTAAPLLLPPNPELPYVIEADASDFGAGRVLLQKGTDGLLHPLAFASKKFSSAERRDYVVLSDHYPLKYFRSQKKPTPCLTRWIAEIELYDPNIQYKPGKDNHVPDLLSRRDGPTCITNEKSIEPDYLYAVKSVQESDWPKFYAQPDTNWPPMYKDLLEKHKDKFTVHNNMVFRKVKIGAEIKNVCYVLFAHRADLVQDSHKSFGQAGKTTVYDLLHKRYWWPHMHSDIDDWLSSCPQCQLVANADRKIHHAPIKPLDVPPAFSHWHLDFIRELPTTINGNRWLLVAMDYATNWVICRSVPDATSEAIAEFIYHEIVLNFGCPSEILTDRGANFMSKVLAHYLGHLKTKHLLTSAFHPCLPSDHLKPFVTLPNSDSQPAPTVSGRVHEARRLHEAQNTYLPPDLRLYVARALAAQRLQDNAAKDKIRWDAILKPQKFAVDDHVLMHHENKLSLEFNWKGPFKVIATNRKTDIYKLQDLHGKIYSFWVHTDRLRPIHVGSNQLKDPWYDLTAVRAAERRHLDAAGRIALLSEA